MILKIQPTAWIKKWQPTSCRVRFGRRSQAPLFTVPLAAGIPAEEMRSWHSLPSSFSHGPLTLFRSLHSVPSSRRFQLKHRILREPSLTPTTPIMMLKTFLMPLIIYLSQFLYSLGDWKFYEGREASVSLIASCRKGWTVMIGSPVMSKCSW